MGQKRIIEMVDGRPRSQEATRPGKYDADIARYGDRFGIKNRIFGGK